MKKLCDALAEMCRPTTRPLDSAGRCAFYQGVGDDDCFECKHAPGNNPQEPEKTPEPPQDMAKRLLATLRVTIEAEHKWICAAQESGGPTAYGRGLISGLEHAIGYIDTMLSVLEKTND